MVNCDWKICDSGSCEETHLPITIHHKASYAKFDVLSIALIREKEKKLKKSINFGNKWIIKVYLLIKNFGNNWIIKV